MRRAARLRYGWTAIKVVLEPRGCGSIEGDARRGEGEAARRSFEHVGLQDLAFEGSFDERDEVQDRGEPECPSRGMALLVLLCFARGSRPYG